MQVQLGQLDPVPGTPRQILWWMRHDYSLMPSTQNQDQLLVTGVATQDMWFHVQLLSSVTNVVALNPSPLSKRWYKKEVRKSGLVFLTVRTIIDLSFFNNRGKNNRFFLKGIV